MAAAATSLPANRLGELMDSSPLVAFYALKQGAASGGDYIRTAACSIEQWVSRAEHRGDTFFARRHWGLVVLSEIDAPIVLYLTSLYPNEDMREPYFEARFRNGDFNAGFNWLAEDRLEISVSGRQELVDRVRHKYGRSLFDAVDAALLAPELPNQQRRGAVLLAGYIADPALASSVRAAWMLTFGDRDLEAFLWAAARVCGDEAETTLGPVCDAWEALPDTKDDLGGSERSSLAAHGIAWKFRDHVPRSALPYFVEAYDATHCMQIAIMKPSISTRIPEELKAAVSQLSAISGQSISAITEDALREYIGWRAPQFLDLKEAVAAADKGEFASADEAASFFTRYGA